jgi:hypothetical protein
MLSTVLTPFVEFFDRWDGPGLADDTEFAVFALTLTFSVILVVCLLLAARSLLRNIARGPIAQVAPRSLYASAPDNSISIFIPPRLLPLRI